MVEDSSFLGSDTVLSYTASFYRWRRYYRSERQWHTAAFQGTWIFYMKETTSFVLPDYTNLRVDFVSY